MRLDEDTLIQHLKIFAQTGVSPLSPSARRKPGTVPPVTEEEMLAAEAVLGFTLPPLLRRFYLEISDGDVQPELLPLYIKQPIKDYPDSIVSWYLVNRSETQEVLDAAWFDFHNSARTPEEQEEVEIAWGTFDERPMAWPEKLLTICDWGCNIYSCLDCSQPACPVLRNDTNISFRTFVVESPSLHEWLEAWLAGKDIFQLDWEQAEKVKLPFG